jgi:hypothetical protein
MRLIWSGVRAFGRFWYEFIVGDDWTVAAAVAVAIAATWGLAKAGISAWWLLPLVVVVSLGLSIRRLERRAIQQRARQKRSS